MKNTIQEQLDNLPRSPGVYLFYNKSGTVIYVGKAVNLFNRVRSYFLNIENHDPKTAQLISQIDHMDFILAGSEVHALVLECNLIKKYRPRYNVRLRDDKMYPYIKIDINAEWPRVFTTRNMLNDNALYFGPYINAGDVKKTLDLIKKIFKYKICKRELKGRNSRPCLNYDLGNCPAPCCGLISNAEYKQNIKYIISFLEGKQEKVISDLKSKMNILSAGLDYEKAALVRDQIKAIQSIIEGQKIGLLVRGDKDVIAIARHNGNSLAELFQFRNNKLVSRSSHIMESANLDDEKEILSNFVKLYYSQTSNIPSEIIVQFPISDSDIITSLLREKKKAAVKIITPSRGTKKELVDIAAKNAATNLYLHELNKYSTLDYQLISEEIKQLLNLKSTPHRIEGYDISNIQGNFAVGSMVVFDSGKPKKDQYRKFRIKIVDGIDDYSMMQEVLGRRFSNYRSANENWRELPDLILIDGGRGHLNAALQVLHKYELYSIPAMSLAKENEEIFVPSNPKPVILQDSSQVLHLFQRIRDEAHRFAVGYHRNLRSKNSVRSALDDISGIGINRKRALLKTFGSVQGIRQASIEELSKIKGMNEKISRRLKQYLETN